MRNAGLQHAVSLVSRYEAGGGVVRSLDVFEESGAADRARHRQRVFSGAIEQAREQGLLSDEHFTVDGTLIESWASFKSFKRKDGEPPKAGPDGIGMVDFTGEKRSNQTHQSSTDGQAKLMRKGNGQPAKLSFGAHALMENRSGLLVDLAITDATVFEPRAALPLVDRRRQARHRMRTLGADKGYYNKAFIAKLRSRKIAPHIAQIERRRAPGECTTHNIVV